MRAHSGLACSRITFRFVETSINIRNFRGVNFRLRDERLAKCPACQQRIMQGEHVFAHDITSSR